MPQTVRLKLAKNTELSWTRNGCFGFIMKGSLFANQQRSESCSKETHFAWMLTVGVTCWPFGYWYFIHYSRNKKFRTETTFRFLKNFFSALKLLVHSLAVSLAIWIPFPTLPTSRFSAELCVHVCNERLQNN